MSMEDCTQPMKVVISASVYCLKSSGNANLFKKYIEHLDNEFQQLNTRFVLSTQRRASGCGIMKNSVLVHAKPSTRVVDTSSATSKPTPAASFGHAYPKIYTLVRPTHQAIWY